jgi:hypothetical protein
VVSKVWQSVHFIKQISQNYTQKTKILKTIQIFFSTSGKNSLQEKPNQGSKDFFFENPILVLAGMFKSRLPPITNVSFKHMILILIYSSITNSNSISMGFNFFFLGKK